MAIEEAAAGITGHVRAWAARAREAVDPDLVDQVEEQALGVLACLGDYLALVGRAVPARPTSIELDEFPGFDDPEFFEALDDLRGDGVTEHMLDLSMIEENLVALFESLEPPEDPDVLERYVEMTAHLLAPWR